MTIDTKIFRKYSITKDIKLINLLRKYILKLYFTYRRLWLSIRTRFYEFFYIYILRNLKNGDEVWMKTETISRSDVQDYFDCEFNYETQVLATTKRNNLKAEDGYEIIINIDTININNERTRKQSRLENIFMIMSY